MPALRLLLLEDNPGDARLVQAALDAHTPDGFVVVCVERLADALARLEAERFDVVLSDLNVPDSIGLDTAQIIAAHAPHLPLVVLTGSSDTYLGREAIRYGAQDYLVKGESSGEIIERTLHYAIERQRLKIELREANAKLEQRVVERTEQLESSLQRLTESEQRYRSLFEGASDAIFVTDDDARILDSNPAASRLSGYSQEENKGRLFADLVPERFYAYVNQLIPEYQLSGVLDSEFPLRTRERSERIVRIIGSRAAPGVYVNILRDITERKRAEDTIQRLAFNDVLTELPNRTALRVRLVQALHQAQIQGNALALLLLDLSNFRAINDTLGHQNGDLVLIEVAGRLRSALRDTDMVARLGGDEFAVLLPRIADNSHVELVVHKICVALHPSLLIEGVPLNVQASIGITLYPEHGDDADTLLQRADVALYAAKAANLSHLLYSRDIDHYNPQQLALMAELRQGLLREELVLHYQPVVDLKSEKIIGVEALVRWQHPSRGLLFPDIFIPAAEKTGLITPLTAWVLACALRQLQPWRDAGSELHMSVNLSVRDLQQPDIVATITNLLKDSGVATQWLTLEITESVIMVNPERAKAVLTELHDLGIRFAIDDFGIGHSSLAYLKNLPVDKMKIDKSFVIGFQDPANAAIVRATIDLAHSLGLSVTAEGVEDEATLDALKVLGCDHAQGYFLSRPQPLDKLNIWLRDSRWSAQEKSLRPLPGKAAN